MSSLTIIGGGPSGMATAYFAKKRGLEFNVFERNNQIGGNCTTFEKDFYFWDSGAHRIHNRNPFVMEEIKKIIGDQLIKVSRPSKIYFNGKFINFPLSLPDLLLNIDFAVLLNSAIDIISCYLKNSAIKAEDFESIVRKRYGKPMADLFLFNYTRKLWGIPLSKLSMEVAGKRLSGLSIKDIIRSFLFGSKYSTDLEGDFYYPANGIGTIMNRLHTICGKQNVYENSSITKIKHNSKRIEGIVVNGKYKLVDHLISTLPVDSFIKLLCPSPPQVIKEISTKFKYRSLTLIVFFLDKKMVSNAATLYFPNKKYPFTRIYEPKNRSDLMAPHGKTSLIVEIPHDHLKTDEIRSNIASLTDSVKDILIELELFCNDEVLDTTYNQLTHAYPVIDTKTKIYKKKITNYLSSFSNLSISGRNSLFKYISLHDVFSDGKKIVSNLQA